MELTGKTVLVTGVGGGDGIGGATAELFAAEGATLIVTGRDAVRGQEFADRIGARFVAADLADPSDVQRLADEVGPVDVLVNNAAVAEGGPAVETGQDVFDRSFAVNVRAPYFLTAAVAAKMTDGGSVINISTMAAQIGIPGLSVYSATKAALESLTRSFAVELASAGIRVNAIAPGPTLSGKFSGPDSIANQLAQTLPLKRAAGTAEIAQAVLFLASDRSSYMTGAVVAVDGGRRAA